MTSAVEGLGITPTYSPEKDGDRQLAMASSETGPLATPGRRDDHWDRDPLPDDASGLARPSLADHAWPGLA